MARRAWRKVNTLYPRSGSNSTYSRIKLLDVELGGTLEPLRDLEGYEALRALVYLHGTPLGHLEVPLLPGKPYAAVDLRRAILRRLASQILRHHLVDLTASPLPRQGVGVEELLETPHPVGDFEYSDDEPLVTVAVCTRDRPEELKLCLDSLVRLDFPNLDLIVVDNAPNTNSTERLVRGSYPEVRYVRELRPGLNWARNRAILEAYGEIIAYTDDDVVVDPGWVSALVKRFHNPNVMSVTGLTVPYELETEAQVLLERAGGFNRGYLRRYWLGTHLGAGQCGAGANMAFRRNVFNEVGYFDPALDAGTATETGGDTEMFFRILNEGHTLVYEPGALVRHRHRREYAQLRKQLAGNSLGTFSYLVRTALTYPDLRLSAIRFGMWWFWYGHLRRLLASFVRPPNLPRDLILTELWHSLVGLGRYRKASRVAEHIATTMRHPRVPPPNPASPREPVDPVGISVGVRVVDLGRPLQELEDVAAHSSVRVFVTHHGEPLGFVRVQNQGHRVGVLQLRDAIADQLNLRLLRRAPGQSLKALRAHAQNVLECHYLPESERVSDRTARLPEAVRVSVSERTARLPDAVGVSVVVPTYDRPQDLRECLLSLTTQATARSLEIIVVDNHPPSGLTPPVVARFPGVVLVNEARRGRSYASNKGFVVAGSKIIASIDDDMVASPDWLEKLVAPLARTDVAAVTGNTLPFELDTPAQVVFEKHFGFWRGAHRWDADSEWFRSFRRRAVRTPLLGGTGNVAFKASILADPQIGPMEEVLGAGMTGTGEDTYLFYKMLRAGYTIAFEPSAYAWHKHRRGMSALRKQIYGYAKGHIAYQLVTLLHDRDLRVMWDLGITIPRWNLRLLARYVKGRLLHKQGYLPLKLILVQLLGYLAGPWALWRAYRRVKREGRSDPYVTATQQTIAEQRIQGEGHLTTASCSE